MFESPLQRARASSRMLLLGGLISVLIGFAATPAWAKDGNNGGGNGNGQSATAGGGGGSATSGGSTQGRSDSNPDGGGVDKPWCETDPRGCQGEIDRDGNNGCGNDVDREDDNNGNCGGGNKKDKDKDEGKDKDKPAPPTTTTLVPTTTTTTTTTNPGSNNSSSNSSNNGSSNNGSSNNGSSNNGSSNTSSNTASVASSSAAVSTLTKANRAFPLMAVVSAARNDQPAPRGFGVQLAATTPASARSFVAGSVFRPIEVRPTVAARVLDMPAITVPDDESVVAFAAPERGARVLGTDFNRQGRRFAFTGGDLLVLALIALATMFLGWRLRRAGDATT